MPAGLARSTLTPFAFAITGLVFFWGLLRYQFLDVTPVARNSIFQVLRDAVLVLDPLDRIVDVNPAAEVAIGLAATNVVGKRLDQVLAKLSVLLHSPAERLDFELETAAASRFYEVRVSPLRDHGSRVTGRVVVLTDITVRKAAEASSWGVPPVHSGSDRECWRGYRRLRSEPALCDVESIYGTHDG